MAKMPLKPFGDVLFIFFFKNKTIVNFNKLILIVTPIVSHLISYFLFDFAFLFYVMWQFQALLCYWFYCTGYRFYILKIWVSP